MEEKPATLVDRYARRMLVENTIEDAINFFHMDALSSAVLLRIDLNLQLTSSPEHSTKPWRSTWYPAIRQQKAELPSFLQNSQIGGFSEDLDFSRVLVLAGASLI